MTPDPEFEEEELTGDAAGAGVDDVATAGAAEEV